ncbi:MAG: Fic family protein, partial [Alcanivorax sp.]|nr:Fic family protein [Alcanivorax sp.]
YCYPDSEVLKNRLNIEDDDALSEAEQEITELAAEDIEFEPPPYDLATLQRIHQQLFGDIYYWAGDIRTVDVSKGDTRFCTTQRIIPEAEKLFNQLEDNDWFEGLSRDALIEEVAELYGDLNMVHPFREGNGRALRLLFEFIIVNAGYEISWSAVDEDEWLEANILSALAADASGLVAIFDKSIGEPITD